MSGRSLARAGAGKSCLWVLLAALTTGATEARGDRVPNPQKMLNDGRAVTEGLNQATGHLFIRLFQRLVSPGDGPRCPFRPSCSDYATEALERDGVLGAILLFDRFIRETRPHDYPKAPDRIHYLDPLCRHPSIRDLVKFRYREWPGGIDPSLECCRGGAE